MTQEIHPQAEKLLAYVDGQLSVAETEEVEGLLASDDSALAFVKKLQRSNLPFAESFEFMLEEDKEPDSSISPEIEISESNSQVTKTNWLWPGSIAASLLLGLVIGYFTFMANTEDHDNWIVRVADYHLLYVRDTVIATHLNPAQVSQLKSKLSKALNTDLNIPDLSAQKLKFKRGQILDAGGKTLIQLAYLPNDGLPVALCILRSNAPDSLPKSGISRGLPYVEWSKDGFSYVIIGKINQQDLEAAAISAASQVSTQSAG